MTNDARSKRRVDGNLLENPGDCPFLGLFVRLHFPCRREKNDPRGSAESARVVLSSCIAIYLRAAFTFGRYRLRTFGRYRPASRRLTAASTSRWSDSRPRGTTT